MYLSEKRRKQSINNNKKEISSSGHSIDQGIESDYNSHADLSDAGDFSLPTVKRKIFSSRSSVDSKASFDSQQHSLGYSSLLSSPEKSRTRTPKKRKFEESESDENAFYNSYEFVSPLKIPKKCAKLVLKEKSSSENVILSSTPIRNSNKTKLWGKFRSLHPEKFNQKSFENAEPFVKLSAPPKSDEASFDIGSSFDFTNSFELTNNEQQDSHIPLNVQQLCSGSLKQDTIAKPTETITKKSQEQIQPITESCPSIPIPSSPRLPFLGGRSKLDILGTLSGRFDGLLNQILSHLGDHDLLRLSHVSKTHRNMIKADKASETKLKAYLSMMQDRKENLSTTEASHSQEKLVTGRKRAFGEKNLNHSMQLRSKDVSPPVSPSRKRFHENQKVAQTHAGLLKKCPRCRKPAKISTIKIRSSPRKKKKTASYISKIVSGRVEKNSKSFFSKSSIDSHSPTSSMIETFLDEHTGSTSSSCASPGPPSSDESCVSSSETPNEAQTYEYGVCSGQACNFKFCVKCNCKSHPRQVCNDFSPVSPTRANKSSVACSRQSLKSLKRLVY